MMNDNISKNFEKYRIKPSARIIATIGEDLIKDNLSAIVELVKNSYDADANNVIIEFSNFANDAKEPGIKIKITDDGHGMSPETVINKWMVPATNDKLKRVKSPKGRRLQGRKGIGRFATALLGEEINLITVDKNGKKTELEINWSEFDKYKYLEEVEIPIRLTETVEDSKNIIEIVGSSDKVFDWSKETIDKLIYELKKLISPISKLASEEKDDSDNFKLYLKFNDFFMVEEYQDCEIEIDPVRLIELYDYRLYGIIKSNGEFDLKFIDNVSGKEPIEEKIYFRYNSIDGYEVGNIKIDLRIFDRDPDSIQNIITRGLKNEFSNEYFGKRETREFIDKMSGIGVYRGGFKVRPYGDYGYDWMELDKARIQSPSKKIGNNQVIGFVEIESEEKSNLEEKSARDGLKENVYFECFKDLLRKAISEAEIRRFSIRQSTGRGRKTGNIENKINSLFDLENLSTGIEKILSEENIDKNKIELVKTEIKKEEKKKEKVIKEIEKIVAIYQGQATLGKIMMILMHEGRKPLSWIKNQQSLMQYYINKFIKDNDEKYLDKIKEKLQQYDDQSNILLDLFKRLEPLAKPNKMKFVDVKVKEVIEESIQVFLNQIEENNIIINITCENSTKFNCNRTDFLIILTNLLENSIYWLNQVDIEEKVIEIKVEGIDYLDYIDIIDNGPGIKKEYIENESIFEPSFTTKYGSVGTGLGLAIAGEASKRNNLKLTAHYLDNGAHFNIKNIDNMGDENEYI